MNRYAALLRGVGPLTARMPDLKRAFEAAGFKDVKTLLSSGNVLFTSARAQSESALEQKAERAMEKELGRSFMTFVRSVEALREILEADPFAEHKLPSGAKKVITFLHAPPSAKVKLPVEEDGVRILAVRGREVFTAYVPSEKGAVFMKLIERTFGKDVTTRTWDTVQKLAR